MAEVDRLVREGQGIAAMVGAVIDSRVYKVGFEPFERMIDLTVGAPLPGAPTPGVRGAPLPGALPGAGAPVPPVGGAVPPGGALPGGAGGAGGGVPGVGAPCPPGAPVPDAGGGPIALPGAAEGLGFGGAPTGLNDQAWWNSFRGFSWRR